MNRVVLVIATLLMSGCSAESPSDTVVSPSARPAAVFIDSCGNTIYNDDDGARRLYVNLAPHLDPSAPYWDDLTETERKAWAAGLEGFLSFSSCPAAK